MSSKRQTFTVKATDADDFIQRMRQLWKKDWECVNVSPSIPVMMPVVTWLHEAKHTTMELHYTVTITGGMLV